MERQRQCRRAHPANLYSRQIYAFDYVTQVQKMAAQQTPRQQNLRVKQIETTERRNAYVLFGIKTGKEHTIPLQ